MSIFHLTIVPKKKNQVESLSLPFASDLTLWLFWTVNPLTRNTLSDFCTETCRDLEVPVAEFEACLPSCGCSGKSMEGKTPQGERAWVAQPPQLRHQPPEGAKSSWNRRWLPRRVCSKSPATESRVIKIVVLKQCPTTPGEISILSLFSTEGNSGQENWNSLPKVHVLLMAQLQSRASFSWFYNMPSSPAQRPVVLQVHWGAWPTGSGENSPCVFHGCRL